MRKEAKVSIVVVVLYYLLNIINTYFVTTAVLNRYLIAFKRNPMIELNSIIGNIAALTILLFIGLLVFKSKKTRLLYIIWITFGLNVGIFAVGIFTKYYSTMFSIYEMTLFYNPALDLAGSIFVEALREIFVYYRILVFIPTIVLSVCYLVIKSKHKADKKSFSQKNTLKYGPMLPIMVLIMGFILSVSTLGVVKVSMESKWPINAERPLYGVQSAGLYNFYLGEFFGINLLEKSDDEQFDSTLFSAYNKNRDTYTNIFGQSYGKTLHISEAPTVEIDPSLLQNNNLNGIFKDKNVVVIHVETFNHFLLETDNPYFDDAYFSNLKTLLDESYVLDNFYTNVGIGNSSDAEFSVMTGLYPRGDTTIYWNYNEVPYVFDALPKLFNGYEKVSLHSDVPIFYNRQNVHENMFEFDEYIYYDAEDDNRSSNKNAVNRYPNHLIKTDEKSPWISDLSLMDWTMIEAERISNLGKNYFLYPIMIQPHTPYLYDPYIDTPLFTQDTLNIDQTALKFINYERYTNDFYEKFFEVAKTLKDTVYIFYADHGSGIAKRDLEVILGRSLTPLEYRTEMLKTTAFIYAPDDTDTTSVLPKGLIKGRQPLVRSQVDLYRTIVELFGVTTNQYYYGVNALSNERTFSIDTRTFDIITDDYYLLSKHLATDNEATPDNVFYYKNPSEVSIDPYEVYEYVIVFKKRMDQMITKNVQQYLTID
ncbi:LTA synthase family protein [Acholeplasma laidlawii]|uniref:LTA synthase family protein n=1 Tax=Acholeplasma laidlawii TaxID=2148 RepID=UPI0021F7FCC4|nr:alkaline phosphatase family protein [Acholeplasma laidlawii]